MAIGTAAAILGSAVIGAGASALTSAKASRTAANAATAAADANAQVSREIYNTTRADLAPYNQAGQGALSALMTRLGLSPVSTGAPGPAGTPQTNPRAYSGGAAPPVAPQPALASGREAAREAGGAGPTNIAPTAVPGPAPAPTAAPAPGGGVNYQQLFTDRPDVKAEYDRLAAQADPNSPWYSQHGLDRGPEGFADYWLANKPAEDTYTAPTLAGNPATTPAADPNAPPPTYASETYDQRPDALAVPTYTRPDDLSAPNWESFFSSDFTKDPSYQYRLDESLKGVNANFAGRGLVRSGDAAVALLKKGGQEASQEYGNQFQRALQLFDRANDNYRYGQDRTDRNFIDDRSYGTNLWNTQQNRQDATFSEDRGFAADRFDQGTSNLFGLVGVGSGAASGAANAGNAFANQTIANNNNRANTTANAAIANGANVTNLFGSAANAIGTYYGMRGSGGSLPRSYSI